MGKFFVCAALALLLPHVHARDVIVNAGDIPPFCHDEDGKPSGIAVDLLREISRTSGITFHIRFLPWKRAQVETQSSADQLIIPLTRTPEREKQYLWIAPLMPYNFVIATRGDRVPPRTVGDAKKMSIGVLHGNPMEHLLPALGFTNVIPGYSEDANAKLLLSNRIDGWIVADVVAKDVYRKAGGNPAELHFGARVGETMWIHLAGSSRFPEDERKLIADELNRLRSTGEADKILGRYRTP